MKTLKEYLTIAALVGTLGVIVVAAFLFDCATKLLEKLNGRSV